MDYEPSDDELKKLWWWQDVNHHLSFSVIALIAVIGGVLLFFGACDLVEHLYRDLL